MVAVFFVDLQKAFDILDHYTKLGKLEHYGIRSVGYNWFQSYLRKKLIRFN